MRFGKRRQATVSLVVVIAVVGGVFIAAGFTNTASFAEEPTVEINRFTVDAGGTMAAAGGGLELSGTIGQPDADVLSGGGLTLAGGFWFGQSPGDSNEDGGINLLDYVELNACASGPGSGFIVPSCACFDHDGDHDVDLEDVAEFQRTFSGF